MIGSPDPVLSIEDLTTTYRGAVAPALDGVTLSVAPGEQVVVTGPSGCGKSTLGLALAGTLFRQYDGTWEGCVTVGGIDARRAPIYAVAEVVGLVQQNPEAQFCTLTVRDEVAFGLENRCTPRDAILPRVMRALETVGAAELVDRALHTLSGGEKQKVAIASVMALEPRVLILDEPTSNLDPRATAAILDVIEAIRASTGMTVIVIEHKLDALRRFDPRVIRMDAGRVVRDVPLREMAPAPARSPEPATCRADAAPVVVVRDLTVTAPDDGTGAAPGRLPPRRLTPRRLPPRRLLDGVSFSLQPGERVAVMGDNGSGKTTLLRALLGLRKPAQGSVTVAGHRTDATPVSRVARDVGFVFQNPDHQLFAETVWEEATTAPRNFATLDDATEHEVRHMLHEAGLGSRLDEHPYRLSYGEKRRLNLISVLAHRPRLLLLDEILIGQDADNVTYLLELLMAAARAGTAVVMVNHAPRVTQQWAERLLFLEQGRLRVDAPVDEGFAALAARGQDVYLPGARSQTQAQPSAWALTEAL